MEQATPTSQLAGQAGLVAPPTTPGGVGALGGTPQQQAMAGSVAQKTSALRQSLDTTTTLGEAEADKRYRSSLTAGEQATADKQKRLGEVLGGTQQKVQDLINAELSKQSSASSAASTTLQTSGAIAAGAGKDQATIDASFAQLIKQMASGSGPTDPIVQGMINSLVTSTGQTAEQIAAAAAAAATKQVQETSGQAAAGTVSDTVNVSNLLPSLGTTREELAGLLGIDPTAVDTMSVGDLDKAVRTVAESGSALSAAETEAASQSGLLGAAERSAMREASREQSTAGVSVAETQLLDLGRALESADTVSFGGRQYTIEQLLSDETLSKLIGDYVTSAPGSEIRKRLDSDPNAAGLLSFVKNYGDALTAAATGIGAAATENVAIQKANKELSTYAPGMSLPDSIMKNIYGSGWGGIEASRREPMGILAALKNASPEFLQQNKQKITNALTMADRIAPEIAPEIASMNLESLDRFINYTGANGHEKTPMETLLAGRYQLNELDSARGNVDSLINMYFGGTVGGTPGLQKLLDDDQKRKSGGYPANPTLAVLDKDRDGVLDKNAQFTLLDLIGKSIESANTPAEVLSGAAGWKPRAAPGALTTAESSAYNQYVNKLMPSAYTPPPVPMTPKATQTFVQGDPAAKARIEAETKAKAKAAADKAAADKKAADEKKKKVEAVDKEIAKWNDVIKRKAYTPRDLPAINKKLKELYAEKKALG